MKNRLCRYDMNRPRPRYGHKYTKHKMCQRKMMVICIKQHLSNIRVNNFAKSVNFKISRESSQRKKIEMVKA